MHETRFANEIISVLKEKLDKGASADGIVVNVRLSPFSHVSAENLRQTFKELSAGEGFGNVSLKVLPLEILLECRACKRSSRIAKRVFDCPFCKSTDIDLKIDKEFFVESFEIERR